MRTSDPSRSEVYSRDSETTRIRLPKLGSFLEILVASYSALRDNWTYLQSSNEQQQALFFSSPYSASASLSESEKEMAIVDNWKGNLSAIQSRLLTAMLLIVRKIHSQKTIFDGFENVSSKDEALFRSVWLYGTISFANFSMLILNSCYERSVFQLAAATLVDLFGRTRHPIVIEPNATRSFGMFTEIVVIRLLQLSLPAASISLIDTSSWQKLLSSNDTVDLTLKVLKRLLAYSITSAALASSSDYSKWRLNGLQVGSTYSVQTPGTGQSTPSTELHLLNGILDLMTVLLDCGLLENHQIADIGEQILSAITNEGVFATFQRNLSSQSEPLMAALAFYPNFRNSEEMGNDKDSPCGHSSIGENGDEEASVSACWRRLVTLTGIIITSIDRDRQNAQVSKLIRQICQFFNDFRFLLLLPFVRTSGNQIKYSFRQLEMIKVTANLFTYANTHINIWKLLCPQVHAGFLERIFPVTQSLSSLLGAADDTQLATSPVTIYEPNFYQSMVVSSIIYNLDVFVIIIMDPHFCMRISMENFSLFQKRLDSYCVAISRREKAAEKCMPLRLGLFE